MYVRLIKIMLSVQWTALSLCNSKCWWQILLLCLGHVSKRYRWSVKLLDQ